jgi:glycogen synthase
VPIAGTVNIFAFLFVSQREFEGIAEYFQNNNNIRLLLKYDDALSHCIYAASDMFIVPSIFEPCGLTQVCILSVLR